MTGGDEPDPPAEPEPEQPPDGITRSGHARLRFRQGRPVGQVVNDIQRAGPSDVFVQPEDGRYVVRGPNAREHIIEPDGEHVTSVRPRTDSAHKARLRAGTIRPATPEEYERLKNMAR
jgi:hypothetical protein